MEVQRPVLELLEQAGLGRTVLGMLAESGGCINECYRLETPKGTFFLKKNRSDVYPEMFRCEQRGLECIRQVVPEFAPAVLGLHDDGTHQYLLLEYVERGRPARDFWWQFAERLERLHRHTAEGFGLDHDNYIGSLPQHNRQQASWADFYINQRIAPQVAAAVDRGLLEAKALRCVENLYRQMPALFPDEPPALLHGDLWSGNYLVDSRGLPRIIDPAIYYGHREMDLAMMDLFGGFDEAVFRRYDELFPLSPGYRQRRPLCQLYPLLVHANLFGGHYISSVWKILKAFCPP